MKFVEIEITDHLGHIWLNRPPYNDFDMQFLDEIIEAHRILEKEKDAWAVLIASRNDKFFSNGMEPDYLLRENIKGRVEIFSRLFELMKVMYTFPKIEASVITGHAMAGGAVLGIVTDFRFMGDGKYRYSFSETRVGLTIPPGLLKIIEGVVGSSVLKEVAMLGRAYKPEEARAIRLVDEVFPHALTLEKSRSFMKSLFSYPLKSLQSVKKISRHSIAAYFDASGGFEDFQDFLGASLEEGLSAVKERRKPVFLNPA